MKLDGKFLKVITNHKKNRMFRKCCPRVSETVYRVLKWQSNATGGRQYLSATGRMCDTLCFTSILLTDRVGGGSIGIQLSPSSPENLAGICPVTLREQDRENR